MENMDYNKIAFYCNACGETFNPFETEFVDGLGETYKDISPDELPEPQRILYKKFQTEAISSLCYVVAYDGKPGMLLVNECEIPEGEESNKTFLRVQECAEHMESLLHGISGDILVILGENTGCLDSHEVAAFLPDTLSNEQMIRAFYVCDYAAYDSGFAPDYKCEHYIRFRNMMHSFDDLSKESALRVEIPGVGTLIVKDVHNDDYPGVAVDLVKPDGSSIGLANIQKGDGGRLQATLFAELGTDDYTHCIDFVNKGEAPVEDVDVRWTSRLTRENMATVAFMYDNIVQEELVVNRLIEAGYEDPINNYPDLFEKVLADFQDSLRYGCEESWSLDEAMKLVEDKDEDKNE